MENGLILFTRAEVTEVFHLIASLLRRVCYGLGITHDDYNTCHMTYAKKNQLRQSAANNNRSNVRMSITRAAPTYKTLYLFIVEILRFDIIDLSITIRSRDTGKTYKFSTSDEPDPRPGMAVALEDAIEKNKSSKSC